MTIRRLLCQNNSDMINVLLGRRRKREEKKSEKLFLFEFRRNE